MKANELRLGNYFNNGSNVDVITPNEIEALYESEDRAWIKPIPLTEEWLLKFGFKREDDDEDMTFQYGLDIDDDMYLLSFTSDIDDINLCLEFYGLDTDQLGKTVYHVHQLQNLYFALTGEELQITNGTKNS